MKTSKLILSLVAFVYASMFASFAATNSTHVNPIKLGVPYSLEYMAQHESRMQKRNSYGDLVVFRESGATQTVYRTYDWEVQFVPQDFNGTSTYYFSTYNISGGWQNTGYDEIWLGDTVSPNQGIYNIIIRNVSGVGGTYEAVVGFTNANGQGDSVWSGDVITDKSDIVFQNVYVNGINEVEIRVNKTQF
jgi:hypothetical protein